MGPSLQQLSPAIRHRGRRSGKPSRPGTGLIIAVSADGSRQKSTQGSAGRRARTSASPVRTPICGECEKMLRGGRSLPPGACSERKVGEDDDDRQESESRHSHQTGMSDVSCAFRFDTGDGSNGGDDYCEAKPCEPAHDERQHTRRSGIVRPLGTRWFASPVSWWSKNAGYSLARPSPGFLGISCRRLAETLAWTFAAQTGLRAQPIMREGLAFGWEAGI